MLGTIKKQYFVIAKNADSNDVMLMYVHSGRSKWIEDYWWSYAYDTAFRFNSFEAANDVIFQKEIDDSFVVRVTTEITMERV